MLILLAGGIAAIALHNISIAGVSTHLFAGDVIPGIFYAEEIQADLFEYSGQCWKHIANSDAAAMAAVERNNEQVRKHLEESIRSYESSIEKEEDRRAFAEFKPTWERYLSAWADVLPISRQGKKDEALSKYLSQVDPAFATLHTLIDGRVTWNKEYADRIAASAAAQAAQGQMLTWTLITVTIGLGAVLTYFIVRGGPESCAGRSRN